MTQQQIINAGIDYTMQRHIGSLVSDDFIRQMHRNPSFEAGAVLAKETIIEEACEWIKNNKHLYKELSFGSLSTDWDKFIREFRKAMKE